MSQDDLIVTFILIVVLFASSLEEYAHFRREEKVCWINLFIPLTLLVIWTYSLTNK